MLHPPSPLVAEEHCQETVTPLRLTPWRTPQGQRLQPACRRGSGVHSCPCCGKIGCAVLRREKQILATLQVTRHVPRFV